MSQIVKAHRNRIMRVRIIPLDKTTIMEGLRLSLLLFFSGLLAVLADDHGAYAPMYSADNFQEKIDAHPHFVMFFAPWCGHCKSLAPTWNKLAEKYNADPEQYGASIARVDCTVETALCEKNEVSGYPTLKFFNKDAEVVRYRGARDQDSLEKFIKEQLGGQEDEPEQPEEKAEEPVEVKKQVIDLTSATFPAHIEKDFRFVKFYAPWCPHCQRLEQTWEDLATAFKDDDKVQISRVDCTEHKQVCTDNSVTGYPSLLWFADGQKVEKYSGGRGLQDLKSYVTQMTNKKTPEKEATDEKVPDNRQQEGDVLDLNKDNFGETVKTGTTFVKFFAPWCGHCKRLAPTWEDLGKKFASKPNIKIAKVDCTVTRDLCSEHGVRGFPTLILFRNGVKDSEHNGPRDLETLSNFVTDKTPHDEL